jgi:hypothetical protein
MKLSRGRWVRLAAPILGVLLSACTWSSVGNPGGVRPGQLPDKVKVWIGDSAFMVHGPIVASDSLSGSWRRVGTGLWQAEKGERFARTVPLQGIRKLETYRISAVGVAISVVGLAAGWCLGGVIDGGDCF